MRKKSILDKQVVKKRSQNKHAGFWEGLRIATFTSLKLAVLLIGIIFISLLFVFLYQYLTTSPYIKLENIIIEGVDERLRSEIIETAGIRPEMSLLDLNLKEVKRNVEEHPWIRRCDLEKHYPHTLKLKVEKESPRALVALDRMYYMNKWGAIFKEVTGNDNKDYPVITGISRKSDNLKEQLQFAASILDLFGSESGPWSIDKISELHLSDDGTVNIYSVVMSAVVKLNGKELNMKKKELIKIVNYLEKTGQQPLVKEINLNFREGAVVSFRKG